MAKDRSFFSGGFRVAGVTTLIVAVFVVVAAKLSIFDVKSPVKVRGGSIIGEVVSTQAWSEVVSGKVYSAIVQDDVSIYTSHVNGAQKKIDGTGGWIIKISNSNSNNPFDAVWVCSSYPCDVHKMDPDKKIYLVIPRLKASWEIRSDQELHFHDTGPGCDPDALKKHEGKCDKPVKIRILTASPTDNTYDCQWFLWKPLCTIGIGGP
jgi:hypothetical protein